jgi:hypothetical protein
MSGLRAFQRRSFLQGVVSGLAGAVVAGSVDHGVARAATEDDYNLEATREGVRSVPFYGRNQAGIGTAPQTAASFLVFDVTAANRGELTPLLRTLPARAAFFNHRWHSAADADDLEAAAVACRRVPVPAASGGHTAGLDGFQGRHHQSRHLQHRRRWPG